MITDFPVPVAMRSRVDDDMPGTLQRFLEAKGAVISGVSVIYDDGILALRVESDADPTGHMIDWAWPIGRDAKARAAVIRKVRLVKAKPQATWTPDDEFAMAVAWLLLRIDE